MRLNLHLALLAPLLLAACVPRLYQRETLAVDHPDLEQFEIRYAEFDGCLLRRPVPVNYHLKRPGYEMDLEVHFGEGTRDSSLGVELSSPDDLTVRFQDLASAPQAERVDRVLRYRINAGMIQGGQFMFDVISNGNTLGREVFQVKAEHCRAISLGDGTRR